MLARHPLLEDLLERLAADVLHDDVAGALVGHEVVDLDDQRVLDLGEELLLGDGRGERVGVAGVEQALEHHPAVGDVAVPGEVDPAEAAVRDRADHLVLAADQVARLRASA